MIKLTAAIAASLLLAGCSTTVKESPAVGAAVDQHYAIQSVRGESTVTLPSNIVPRLEKAIRSELLVNAVSGPPATLEFTISEYRVRSAQARAFIGALWGADHLRASVILRDPQGAVVRQFEVNRAANMGGFGALIDQEDQIITDTAKSIAETAAK